MRRNLAALLLSMAQSPFGGWLAGWVFAHMSFVIPVERLRETATLIAFYHPKPSYPLHILIVPKRALANVTSLSAADADFLADLARTVKSLVDEYGLDQHGYRLITNGGAYQDVAQLHFHLVSETASPSGGS